MEASALDGWEEDIQDGLFVETAAFEPPRVFCFLFAGEDAETFATSCDLFLKCASEGLAGEEAGTLATS